MQAPAVPTEQPLFPSFDALETVIWPGVAVAVFEVWYAERIEDPGAKMSRHDPKFE